VSGGPIPNGSAGTTPNRVGSLPRWLGMPASGWNTRHQPKVEISPKPVAMYLLQYALGGTIAADLRLSADCRYGGCSGNGA
jgi:hypothetical protein